MEEKIIYKHTVYLDGIFNNRYLYNNLGDIPISLLNLRNIRTYNQILITSDTSEYSLTIL